jgi:Na+-transporting NADH:ubiquinone oxidoreductase subunit NqrE
MGKGGPPPRSAVVAWCLVSGVTVLFGIAMATGIVQDETYNNVRGLGVAFIVIGVAALVWQVFMLKRWRR